jgi:hypothetical protein
MAIYRYKDSPLVDHVKVDMSHQGAARATIVSAANVDKAKFEALRMQLGAKDISTLMDTVNGRPTLQIRGFKDADALLNALTQVGISRTGMKIEKTAEDKKTKSFRDKVRGKALFLSAIFYDLGNIAFIISGIQRGRHNKSGRLESHDYSEIGTGAAFSVGDLLMTFFGHDKGDEELQAAAWGLKRHLHKKGIEVPEGDALNPDTLHQSGTLKATDRWLRKHIIHIKCLSELAGGLFTIHAGLKQDAHGNKNLGKLTAGLLISTGWLATFLLDKPRGHHIFDDDMAGSGSLSDKMINNPRAWIARPLAMGNNVANLWGSLNPKTGERARFRNELLEAEQKLKAHNSPENHANMMYAKNRQHDYMYNVFSACSFLIAHTLFGMSDNKRVSATGDDKVVMDDMVLLAANVLTKQPEAVRAASIDEAAEFVSGLAHIKMTKEQAATAIREKIQGLSQGAWSTRAKNTSPAQPGLSTSH